MLRYGESVFTKESKGTEFFIAVALLCKFWSTSKLCIYRYFPASSCASNVRFKKGKHSLSHKMYSFTYTPRGRRLIGISGSLIWSKTLMELMFNPYGEFRWIPEGLVCWCPWDIFRSFEVCSDAKERVGCGKQREATAPIKSLGKTAALVPEFALEACLRQNCCLGFSACSEGPDFGQNTDDDDTPSDKTNGL